MPSMSVIIVNWNGKHFLEDCLEALRRQTFRDFETILVDNGSSDGSIQFVQTRFPEVKLVSLRENRGFTGGNIAGYEFAQGELIVLLNNDTEAHPNWLEEIQIASLLFPKAGSFASKMMYFDARNRIENCGFSLSSAGATTDLGRDEADGCAWNACREVFGACGGAAAYRRSMLNQIGFLDPDFFMVYEDVDLSFRAQLRGYACVYIPTAIVFHRYRASLGSVPGQQVFYSQRNIEFVYLKNMPTGLILRSLPERFLYEAGSAVYFLQMGAFARFLAAKLDVLRHLPSVLRKRHLIQKNRTLEDSELRARLTPGLASKWRKLRSCWE
jgi:GT2 family glycosyltransferase